MRHTFVRLSTSLACAAALLPLTGAMAQDAPPAAAPAPQGEPKSAEKPAGNSPAGFGRPAAGQTAPANNGTTAAPGAADQRKARALQPYVQVLPDLTEAQKDQIFQILEKGNAEVRAMRENPAYTDEQKLDLREKLRVEIPLRAMEAMTEPQKAKWKAVQEELRIEQEGTVTHLGNLKAKETREEKRARLTAGYEPVLEELSVRKKTDVMAALGQEDDAIARAMANDKLSAGEKAAASAAARAATLKSLEGILSAEQLKQWKVLQQARLQKDTSPGDSGIQAKGPANNDPAASPKP